MSNNITFSANPSSPTPSLSIIAERVHRSGLISTRPRKHRKLDNQPVKKKIHTFLELLPADVAMMVISNLEVETDSFHRNITSLAQVSKVHREAFLMSQFYFLEVLGISDFNPAYLELFKDSISGIRLLNIDFYSVNQEVQRILFQLLGSHTLRSASIHTDYVALDIISRTSSVRRLELKVKTKTSMKDVIKTIKALDLIELRLICVGVRKCIFDHVRSKSSWKKIALDCPNVITLELGCQCGFDRGNSSIISLIQNMPMLTDLTIGLPEQVPLLDEGKLKVLKLKFGDQREINFEKMAVFASSKPQLTTSIQVPTKLVLYPPRRMVLAKRESFSNLRVCKRLKKLHLGLLRGAEKGMPDLPSLCHLNLQWFERGEGEEIQGENISKLHVPERGFFQTILNKTGNKLRLLSLFGVRISKNQLKILFMGMGEMLLKFGMTLWGQEEDELEFMIVVMGMLATYNRALKETCLSTRKVYFDRIVDNGGMNSIAMSNDISRKLMRAIRLLKERAVGWDIAASLKGQVVLNVVSVSRVREEGL